MDKYEKLLQEKANEEKEKYTVPKSFEDRIEKTLEALDSDSSKQVWYKNKKFLAMVAGFAFVFIIGANGIININNSSKNGASPELASETYDLSRSENKMEMATDEFGSVARERVIRDENNIYSITLKYFGEDSKYKNIDNSDDVSKIINFINSLEFIETQEKIGSEWDFVIQINGNINTNIIIRGNLLSVDDSTYEILNWNKDGLMNLYNELNYEETQIKYCPTN